MVAGNLSKPCQYWISSRFVDKIIQMPLRWWNTQERDNLNWNKAVMYILNLGRYINPYHLPSVKLADKSELPEESGIYFAIADTEIFYIGKAQNIKHRWIRHHRYKQLCCLVGLRLHWLKCSSAKLFDVEKECIAKFFPTLNLQPISNAPPKSKSTYRYHLVNIEIPCSTCGSKLKEKLPIWRNKKRRYKVTCACCNHLYGMESL